MLCLKYNQFSEPITSHHITFCQRICCLKHNRFFYPSTFHHITFCQRIWLDSSITSAFSISFREKKALHFSRKWEWTTVTNKHDGSGDSWLDWKKFKLGRLEARFYKLYGFGSSLKNEIWHEPTYIIIFISL